jgi:plastocyanin
MRTQGKLVVGGIAVAVVAVTIIIITEGANLQKPADIVQQEPSRQTAISVAETVTITIPEGVAGQADGSNEEHYVPELATVSSGSQVTWINADTVGHTATSGTPAGGPSGQFDTGTILPGESKSVMVEAKGGQSLLYYCTIHPWLTGELQMTL